MKGLYIGFAAAAAAAAAVFAIGLYLVKRKKNEFLIEEIVDEIEFDKIIEFFREKKSIEPAFKAIGLRINKTSDMSKYNLSYLKGKEGIVLAFYNESLASIDTANSKILISNKLDKQTLEAFGDKEMIIFN